jgi:glycosyl transferase-like sugar-binding protein
VIPQRLIRVVPEKTTDEVELWWKQACALHPMWNHVTYRDPISPRLFPLTRDLWGTCKSGAQLADLVRAEELYHRGGVYIDSDVEVFKSFAPLTLQHAFAGYEEPGSVPNAILGFRPHHPALLHVLRLARERHAIGTYDSGAKVTCEVLPTYDDVLLLPPGAFYPVYWKHKDVADWSRVQEENPWAYCCHHAAHSWEGT